MPEQLTQSAIRMRLDGKHQVVSDWADFHAKVAKMTDSAWIFRGVHSPTHYPVPGIGREAIYGPYKLAQEIRLLQAFKDQAIAISPRANLDDWQWLAYAQHVGVPTRLLDWSTNPLIAAFFAVEDNGDEDRLIYCVKYSRYIHEVASASESPFENKEEGRFSPPVLFDRLRSQRGVFTIHPQPTMVFYTPGMKVLRIPRKLVKDFKKRLFKFGIDYWHVYPDFEGLGKQISWQYRNRVGLGSIFKDKKD